MIQVKHKPSLKTVYKKLERNEPWTNIEEAQFNAKERALIRSIQLRDKENKHDAIQTYTNYQIDGKRAVKSLATSLRKYNKDHYPKIGGRISHGVDDFERPSNQKKLKKEKSEEKRMYLNSKKNKTQNPKIYKRVESGNKKYPNASLGELRHGVNSKWSQEYRVRNGRSRNYK